MHRRIAMLAVAACAAQAEPITFYKDIAPIGYRSCVPCHRPGEPGPFPLLTYADVRKHGAQIVSVIKRRYMPPWLPEAGHGEFQEDRRLTDDQIRTIEEWVRQGAPAVRQPMPRRCPGSFPAGNSVSPIWSSKRPRHIICPRQAPTSIGISCCR